MLSNRVNILYSTLQCNTISTSLSYTQVWYYLILKYFKRSGKLAIALKLPVNYAINNQCHISHIKPKILQSVIPYL